MGPSLGGLKKLYLGEVLPEVLPRPVHGVNKPDNEDGSELEETHGLAPLLTETHGPEPSRTHGSDEDDAELEETHGLEKTEMRGSEPSEGHGSDSAETPELANKTTSEKQHETESAPEETNLDLEPHLPLYVKPLYGMHADIVLYDKHLPLRGMQTLKWENGKKKHPPDEAPCMLVSEYDKDCDGKHTAAHIQGGAGLRCL